jgi:predicted DNA-binding protein (UPF0251 family)/DNA-directed RNA polymerase subunit RPC12/RpoP
MEWNLARPQKDRFVTCDPTISYFKPRGVPLREMDEVRLTIDQMEAIRLADLEGLSQQEAGQRMGVSRATFGRIIQRARRVVAEALIHGKAIMLEGGHYQVRQATRQFVCRDCEQQWEAACGTGPPEQCPACGSRHFQKMS